MVWAKLDDEILDNPKIVRAGVYGFALHVAGIAWCARNLTDGVIPAARVRSLLMLDRVSIDSSNPLALLDGPRSMGGEEGLDALVVADHLVACGLWHHVAGGYEINDYLDYNPSREKVLSERERGKERKARSRADSGRTPSGLRKESGTASDGPDPDPDPDPKERERARARGDMVLDEAKRSEAQAVIDPSGETVDVDAEWAKYLADREARGRSVSSADWRGWVLKAIGFSKRERMRESDRKAAAIARRDPPPKPKQTPEQAKAFADKLASFMRANGSAR